MEGEHHLKENDMILKKWNQTFSTFYTKFFLTFSQKKIVADYLIVRHYTKRIYFHQEMETDHKSQESFKGLVPLCSLGLKKGLQSGLPTS